MNQPEEKKLNLASQIPEPQQDPIPAPEVPIESLISQESDKPVSTLPEGQVINMQMDRKNYQNFKNNQNPATNNATPTDGKKGRSKFSLDKVFQDKKTKNIVKVVTLLSFCIIGSFVILVASYLTGIDTAFIKITLDGVVTDQLNNEKIPNAEILINDEVVGKTNESGKYVINGLEPQTATIKVRADGYREASELFGISRGILDYTATLNFTLLPSERATVSGKFITSLADYKFIGDKLSVGDTDYPIQNDGSFIIENLKTGNIQLKFQSINFKDITKDYTITSGANEFEDINLEPAGDIQGNLKSYVNETVVTGTLFEIENIPSQQIEIKEDQYIIKDLDIGKKYKINVKAEGYLTREYEVDIKQGENRIFNFKLVENGLAVYLKNKDRNVNFFSSDFDGNREQSLTNLTRFNPTAYYLNVDENVLYFTSRHERISGVSSNTSLAYSIKLDTKQLSRVTTNINSLGTIYSNLKAKKLVSVNSTRVSSSITTSKITIMNLDGNGREEVRSVDNGEFSNILISDDGKNVFFYEDSTSENSGLYRYNTDRDELKLITKFGDVSLYDSTNNGNKLLIGRKNTSTGFVDLVLYLFDSNEFRTLDENLDGLDYQYIGDSEDELIYHAKREGKDNIYKFTITINKDERITSLSNEYIINDIFQQKNYVFYTTNKGLYILDINKPQSFKLVTEGVYFDS